jgi:hypothetical protein
MLLRKGRHESPPPFLISETAGEDIADHGRAPDQVELLKDHRHPPARPAQFGTTQGGDVLISDVDAA